MLLAHGVDGLVLLGVALVLGDVGRQGHVARRVDGRVERARLAGGRVCTLWLKAHETPALGVLHEVGDLAGEHHRRALGRVQATGAVLDDGTGLEALARVHEALPDVAHGVEVLAALEQQRLGHAARLGLAAHEARRHDARLVGHEQVARLEVVDDVGEATVLDRAAIRDGGRLPRHARPALAVQHEQAARVARLCRSLGNELVGKRIVEVVGSHGCPLEMPPGTSGRACDCQRPTLAQRGRAAKFCENGARTNAMAFGAVACASRRRGTFARAWGARRSAACSTTTPSATRSPAGARASTSRRSPRS